MRNAVEKRKLSSMVYSDFRRLGNGKANMVDVDFGCGIALTCGKFKREQDSDQDVWGEGFVALPTELAVELISWDAMGMPDGWKQQRRQEFMGRLGLHPDARLRALAAAEPWIADVIVKKLASDPAYAVRSALSRNPSLIASMKTPLAVSLVNNDAELIENLLRSMMEALEMKIREAREIQGKRPRSVEDFNRVHQMPREVEKLKQKNREIIEMFSVHTDPSVRSCALEMNARLRLLCESPDELVVSHLHRRIRSAVAAFERDFEDGFDELDYALVYLVIDEGSQRVRIDRYMGALPLSLEALTEAAWQLPSRQTEDTFVLQLAGHPAATVRAAIASRSGLSMQAIEQLKNDKTYVVRRSMLNNEEILMELSGEDILGILADDAGLFAETFGYCPSRRISRLLKERFAESEDPYVREIISRFED